MSEINLQQFPSTRYQGSKRKILPWIHDALKDLEFTTVLDACGGSGSVSYLFKKMGKSVTFNDKLKFNFLIGKAIIENQTVNFTKDDLRTLIKVNSQFDYTDFIEKTFKDVYYLPKENRFLDTVTSNIIQMNHYEDAVLKYKKAIAYYALFQASLIKRPFNMFHRNNLYLRTNDVRRSFGNKVSWDRSFGHYMKRFIGEANKLVFDSGVPCYSTNQSILDIDGDDFDLIYIDSPYLNNEGKNETADYLRCYHFLEGISNYEGWNALIDYDTNNLRLQNPEKSNLFSKENIYSSFEKIFEKFRDSIIVVSYKKNGTPSINYLVKTMKKFKRKVSTKSRHYKYALNKQNGNAEYNREVLIIGK